jgi:hypothetical protein
MFSGQLERYFVMVETGSVTVEPIMAAQAVAAEILRVRLHESCIDFGMAGGANGLVEIGVTLCVAVVANIG